MTVAVSSFSEFYGSTRGGGTVPLFHKRPIIPEIMRDLAAGVVTTRVVYGLDVWSHRRSAGSINWVLIPVLPTRGVLFPEDPRRRPGYLRHDGG